ncbi:hypothetical protein M9H77_23059 [Catharanthus roseus]|uniref:Uncharacterized protein n=1 Tax=Catharanthus roseus TaxID=4058 RepID=A0ACC0AW86_CATRO|nr:hypothetical protein M9H77_23059 [Catharanthus roseus]
MAMSKNWQVFVHDGRHNHAIDVYIHCHTQAAKLMEGQLIQIEQFRNSHVLPRNILRFFWEQNVGCAVSAQKIYNVVAKIKKNRMQGRNTVEEVLYLSDIRDYTVFYRNCEDSNMLSDIVVAHPTSIEMLRTWPYILIMDTTYKTNKYNMPLLEVVGMTPTGILKEIRCSEDEVEEQTGLPILFVQQLVDSFAHKFVRCCTKSHMYFGVETTNRAESEHLVLKLWLSTCYGDLDTVFLNIDSLIEGQIADIKASLEFSKTKEKNNAKSNHIFYILSNKISHLALKKIWSEIARAVRIYDDPENKPSVTLTSPPEVAVNKGRKKTNLTKRDKLHWEHVSITHRKIQKSSGSVSGSGSGTGSGSLPGSGSGSGSRGRGRLPRAPRERGRGHHRGRSSLSTMIHASPCSTFPYTNAFPSFIYPFISNWKNVIGDGNCGYRVVADFVFGDEHQWPEKVHWLSVSGQNNDTLFRFIIVLNGSTIGQIRISIGLQIGT